MAPPSSEPSPVSTTAAVWTHASIQAVARHCQSDSAPLLPRVLQQTISSFLDPLTDWTLESASSAGGSVRLLDRLLAREWSDVDESFRRARFLHAMESVAATAGHVTALEWWRSQYLPNGPDATEAIFRVAAHEGHAHVFQWLFDSADAEGRTIPPIGTQDSPVYSVHAEILSWLHARNRKDHLVLVMDQVAKKGDLEFMKWALGHADVYSFQYTVDTVRDAAEAGHLQVLQWLRASNLVVSFEKALEAAATGGHVPIVTWLLEEYPAHSFEPPSIRAACNGHIEVVQWMVEQYPWKSPEDRSTWITEAFSGAVSNGHWTVIRYLFKQKPLTHAPFSCVGSVVHSGDLELVQWLHVRGVVFTGDPIGCAALDGNIPMIEWLHENSVMGAYSLDHAFQLPMINRHLDVIEWLHAHGAQPTHRSVMTTAGCHADVPLIKWMHEHWTQYWSTDVMDHAAERGSLEVIKFLHANRQEGCTTKAMNKAARNGHLSVVRWLHANRPEGCTKEAVNHAAERGHHKVLAFLLAQFELKCDYRSVERAARRGHFEVLELLMRRDPQFATQAIQAIWSNR